MVNIRECALQHRSASKAGLSERILAISECAESDHSCVTVQPCPRGKCGMLHTGFAAASNSLQLHSGRSALSYNLVITFAMSLLVSILIMMLHCS